MLHDQLVPVAGSFLPLLPLPNPPLKQDKVTPLQLLPLCRVAAPPWSEFPQFRSFPILYSVGVLLFSGLSPPRDNPPPEDIDPERSSLQNCRPMSVARLRPVPRVSLSTLKASYSDGAPQTLSGTCHYPILGSHCLLFFSSVLSVKPQFFLFFFRIITGPFAPSPFFNVGRTKTVLLGGPAITCGPSPFPLP